MSITALAHGARDLQLIIERQYRYLFNQLSMSGWRTQEPDAGVPVEKPRAFREMPELVYGMPVDYNIWPRT
jgi:hypothetical protein